MIKQCGVYILFYVRFSLSKSTRNNLGEIIELDFFYFYKKLLFCVRSFLKKRKFEYFFMLYVIVQFNFEFFSQNLTWISKLFFYLLSFCYGCTFNHIKDGLFGANSPIPFVTPENDYFCMKFGTHTKFTSFFFFQNVFSLNI